MRGTSSRTMAVSMGREPSFASVHMLRVVTSEQLMRMRAGTRPSEMASESSATTAAADDGLPPSPWSQKMTG